MERLVSALAASRLGASKMSSENRTKTLAHQLLPLSALWPSIAPRMIGGARGVDHAEGDFQGPFVLELLSLHRFFLNRKK